MGLQAKRSRLPEDLNSPTMMRATPWWTLSFMALRPTQCWSLSILTGLQLPLGPKCLDRPGREWGDRLARSCDCPALTS